MSQRPTLAALAAALANGEATAVDLVSEATTKARSARAAFIEIFDRQALAEAEASDRRRRVGASLGPFDGIPFAAKDLFDIAGSVTTAGSATRKDFSTATQDATIIAKLRRHGLIPVGKTNLSEFAFSGLGLNPHFGTPVASQRPGRAPGGSSSGSAVALADGVVPVALGTDTAGSVRIPAAFNGLVGYRPSLGRYDQQGVFPLAEGFDVAGPMANTVGDCRAMDLMMGGSRDPAPTSGLPYRFVVDEGSLGNVDLDPGLRRAVLDFAERASRAGAQVETKRVRAIQEAAELIARVGWLGGVEAARFHRARLAGPERAMIDPVVVSRLEGASRMPANDVQLLYSMRRRLMAEVPAEAGAAIVVTPATLTAAPLLEPLIGNDELFAATNLRTLFLTMISSYLNMPGVVIPQGCSPDGVPLSVLLNGSAGTDLYLLGAAEWAAAV